MTGQNRYLVVEGPIGVGKTSLAKKLAASLGHELLLETVQNNPFLEQFYRNPRQFALPTQLSFLMQRAQQVEEFRQVDLFQTAYIADFLIDKDRLFAELTLNHEELRLYQQIFAHLTIDAPRPDLVIYLQAPLSVLRERIFKRGIDYEQKIKADYLSRLSDSYTHFFFEYEGSALLTVNTQFIDPVNNNQDYQNLVDKIEQIHAGRHYFNQSSLPYA